MWFIRQNANLRTSRGNLYKDCLFAALKFGALVAIVCAGYDLICGCAESCQPDKESAFRFIYAHSGLVFTVVSLLAAFLAVYVTVKVNETMSLHSFNVRYGEDAMCKTIREVSGVGRRWREADGTGLVAPVAFLRTEVNNPDGRIQIANMNQLVKGKDRYFPWTEEEDFARRRLKNFFSSALELYRSRSISLKTMRNICDNDSFRLLFTVVEPMEYIINEKYNYDVFFELMNIMKDVYSKYGDLTKSHEDVRHYWDSAGKTWQIAKN